PRRTIAGPTAAPANAARHTAAIPSTGEGPPQGTGVREAQPATARRHCEPAGRGPVSAATEDGTGQSPSFSRRPVAQLYEQEGGPPLGAAASPGLYVRRWATWGRRQGSRAR